MCVSLTFVFVFKHYAKKAYGGKDVMLHALFSLINGGE
jgi:hypothetical protein